MYFRAIKIIYEHSHYINLFVTVDSTIIQWIKVLLFVRQNLTYLMKY